MDEVFISYQSSKLLVAEHLADILNDHGFSVWYDHRLFAGRHYGPQIEEKLESAKCVVVIWCNQSIQSDWVHAEAKRAYQLRTYCPVKIEPVKTPLEFMLAQTIDLSNWDGAPRPFQPAELIREVERLVGREAKLDRSMLDRFERTWRRYGSLRPSAFAKADLDDLSLGEPVLSPTDAGGVIAPSSDFVGPVTSIETDTAAAIVAGCELPASGGQHVRQLRFAPTPALESAIARLSASKGNGFLTDTGHLTIKTLQRLAELPRLQSLSIKQSNIGSLDGLSACTSLKQLLLNDTDVSDVSAISNLRALETLSLTNSPVEDIRPLSSLKSLKVLSLTNSRVEDLSPISALPALEKLFLVGTPVSDLLPLASLSALNTLFLSRTNVSDLKPLCGNRLIDHLYLTETLVEDLRPLEGLTELRVLVLDRTPVTDVRPLLKNTKLKSLFLRDTNVRSVHGFEALTSLKALDLAGTQVTDLGPTQHVQELIKPDGSKNR